MAKKFGKRSKVASQDPAGVGADPRDMFGAPPPLPRQAGAPASSTPLADYLGRGWPGVDQGYVVLPRSIAESMSLPWQQQLVNLLGQFHQAHGRLSWPVYRVVPSRHELLVDLDEEQLAEAGYLVEIDTDGEMIYRERSGRKVADPAHTKVLVPCLDPIVPARANTGDASGVPQARPPEGQVPAAEPPPQRREPAPMNIGPPPVWPTTRPSQEQPEEPAQTELETPPRGIPIPEATVPGDDRGWFDEMPSEEGKLPTEPEREEQVDFGPTGEPTEIPYRYH